MLVCKAVNSIQFSSVHFDLITQETVLHASPTDRRFSCRSWAPLVGMVMTRTGDNIITILNSVDVVLHWQPVSVEHFLWKLDYPVQRQSVIITVPVL